MVDNPLLYNLYQYTYVWKFSSNTMGDDNRDIKHISSCHAHLGWKLRYRIYNRAQKRRHECTKVTLFLLWYKRFDVTWALFYFNIWIGCLWLESTVQERELVSTNNAQIPLIFNILILWYLLVNFRPACSPWNTGWFRLVHLHSERYQMDRADTLFSGWKSYVFFSWSHNIHFLRRIYGTHSIRVVRPDFLDRLQHHRIRIVQRTTGLAQWYQ